MIYVLDDDPTTLKLITTALSSLGPVKGALLWSELSRELMRDSEDQRLLVCDLQMPGIQGTAFCEIVRRYSPECKIVIYSGAVDQHDPETVQRVSDVVVAKSEGLERLVQCARELLGFRRSSS